MTISNEDIKQLVTELPEGHKHLRTTIFLKDGREFTLQEAAIENLVWAYIAVKTLPTTTKVILKGKYLNNRKKVTRNGNSRTGFE